MSSAGLVQQFDFSLPVLKPLHHKVSIEVGRRLVKIIAVVPETSDETRQQFKTFTFKRSCLQDALKCVEENYSTVCGTGSDGQNRGALVRGHLSQEEVALVHQILHLEPVRVVGINKMESRCRALQHLVQHKPQEDWCYQRMDIPELLVVRIMWPAIAKMAQDMQAEIDSWCLDPNSRFPCLFIYVGACEYVARLNEDGSHTMIYYDSLAGEHLLGVSQAVLGVSDFSRVTELASSGNRGNVDTQVKDILDNSADGGPYGALPGELPLFALGKFVDIDELRLENARPEDLAHSLVALMCNTLWRILVTRCCLSARCKTVFVAGPLFESAIFRKNLQLVQYFLSADIFDVHVVKPLALDGLGTLLQGV